MKKVFSSPNEELEYHLNQNDLSHKVSQEYNKNKFDQFINKDSYIYLYSKKLNNNKNNSHQSFLNDCPQPEIYQEYNFGNNNSFNINSNKNNNFSNKYTSNRNDQKLLEEYFQLKNEYNYNSSNNIYLDKKEECYHPLIKKNKIRKNNNQNNNINFKKSNSFKGELIYKPEKNIKNSPSFTPIKSGLKKKKNSNNRLSKNVKYFNLNTNVNEKNKRNIISNLTQRKNNENINSKRGINRKENEKSNRNRVNKTPTKKNLTLFNNINYNRTYSIDKNEVNNENYMTNNFTQNNYEINSTELYWKKKDKEKEKKLEQIRTERILKEDKEMQDRPKINENSRKIINKKGQKKIDVFDRLSDINQIKNHMKEIEKIKEKFKESHTPYINDNSRKMKRTIDDLYIWKNKNERKKTESANNFNKMINKNKIKINPISEEILKENKYDYLNKRVEDRLLEQGRLQQYKNEMEREKYLRNVTMSTKYINNDYINIQSRYLNHEKNYKSCERIINDKCNNKNNRDASINNNSFEINNSISKKEISFKNKENNLSNGDINNYIINNNYNYKYFPNYNYNKSEDEISVNKGNNLKELKNRKYKTENNFNNYEEPQQNYNNNKLNRNKYPLKLINRNEEKFNDISSLNNNNVCDNNNNMNESEKNDIINIRRHLNEFYENKKKLNLNNSNLLNKNESEKFLLKNDSIKNNILKGLLSNNNLYNKNSKEERHNNYSYYQTNTNNSRNNFDNNSTKENNVKYNFNQDFINNIHKVPKSSGLNFNTNKMINNFQFQFKDKDNEMNDNPKIGVNDFNFDRKKYTINDSINVNGLGSPSINIVSIKNNINKENNEYKFEKERRKQDLLQMINFSSNLGMNIQNINSLKK